EERCTFAVAGDPRYRELALSRRWRRRLLQRGRASDRPPQDLSPSHLLRIFAVLRRNLRGAPLPLSAGARGALCVVGLAVAAGHAGRRRTPGWSRGTAGCEMATRPCAHP